MTSLRTLDEFRQALGAGRSTSDPDVGPVQPPRPPTKNERISAVDEAEKTKKEKVLEATKSKAGSLGTSTKRLWPDAAVDDDAGGGKGDGYDGHGGGKRDWFDGAGKGGGGSSWGQGDGGFAGKGGGGKAGWAAWDGFQDYKGKDDNGKGWGTGEDGGVASWDDCAPSTWWGTGSSSSGSGKTWGKGFTGKDGGDGEKGSARPYETITRKICGKGADWIASVHTRQL